MQVYDEDCLDSDGMTMGTDGMRYSLPSRDIIADSIEMVRSLSTLCYA